MWHLALVVSVLAAVAAATEEASGSSGVGGGLRSSSENVSRRAQIPPFPGSKCSIFPLGAADYPLGLSIFEGNDGSAPLCGATNELMFQTFQAAAMPDKNTATIPTNDNLPLDCAAITPSTMVSLLRVSSMSPFYQRIIDCLGLSGTSHILMRAPPKGGPIVEIATKDGLQELVMKHTDCDGNLDSCIIPETFRIADSLQDCQIFFYQLEFGTFRNREWVSKPTNSYAGQGVSQVVDIDAELVVPYGDCSQIGTHPNPIVVQRLVTPWLVDGHSCHVRTYFAFKFPSLPKPGVGGEDLYDPDNYDDPPQAWHVDAGNVHICTQPWSQIDDVDMGDYAFTCNKPWYVESPDDFDFRNFVFPFPRHLLNTFNPELFQEMMEGIGRMFQQLGIVLARQAADTGSFAAENEAAWTVIGVDVIVGREQDTIRPWLIDINTCPKKPFEYDSQHLSDEWNPYVSILRVIGSHFRRKLLGDSTADEEDCIHDKLTARINRVL